MNKKYKRILILSTMFTMLAIGFNISPIDNAVNYNKTEDNAEEINDVKKIPQPTPTLSNPKISGTGVTLPLKGYSNASRLGETVSSLPGGQSSNFAFVTPDNFWTGTTAQYDSSIVTVSDIVDQGRNVIETLNFNANEATLSNYSDYEYLGGTDGLDDSHVLLSQENPGSDPFSADVGKIRLKSVNTPSTVSLTTSDGIADGTSLHIAGTTVSVDPYLLGREDEGWPGSPFNSICDPAAYTGASAEPGVSKIDQNRQSEDWLGGDSHWCEDIGGYNQYAQNIWSKNTGGNGITSQVYSVCRNKWEGDADYLQGSSYLIYDLHAFQTYEFYYPFTVTAAQARAYMIDFDYTTFFNNYRDSAQTLHDIKASITLTVEFYSGGTWTDPRVVQTYLCDSWDDGDWVSDGAKTDLSVVEASVWANKAGSYRIKVNLETKLDVQWYQGSPVNAQWYGYYSYIQAKVNNLGIDYNLESPYDVGRVGFESDTVNFGSKKVEQNGRLNFDVYLDPAVNPSWGYNNYDGTNTLSNADAVVVVGFYTTSWTYFSVTKSLSAIDAETSDIWHCSPTEGNVPYNYIDQAVTIKVWAYLDVKSNFAMHYNLAGNPDLIFHNITLKTSISYNLNEVDLNLQLTSGGSNILDNYAPLTDPSGTQVIINNNDYFNIDNSDGFRFTSTHPGLTFNFDYTTTLSWTTSIPTTYYAEVNGNTVFRGTFTYNLNTLNLGAPYDVSYRSTIRFDMGLPNWNVWDLSLHNYTTQPSIKLGVVNSNLEQYFTTTNNVGQYETDDYIVVDKATQYPGYAGTQTAKFHNRVVIKYGVTTSQTWEMNFTMPSIMDNLVLSTGTDEASILSNPVEEYLAGSDWVNFYTHFTKTFTGGYVGAMYYNPSGVLQYAPKARLLNGNDVVFAGLNQGWQVGFSAPNLGGYYVRANYTGNATSAGITSLTGIVRACVVEDSFTVIHNTNYKICITPKTYDTSILGFKGVLLNITINWSDTNTGVGITGITTKSFLETRYNIGLGAAKVAQNNLYQLTEKTNGNYTIKFFPEFYHSNLYQPGGTDWYSIPWGYHNFTITLEKTGYRKVTITGDFQIIVDTFMKVGTPSHELKDDDGYPHFRGDAIMGEQFEISTYLYQNRTSGDDYYPIIDVLGEPYYRQIQVNYSLVEIRNGSGPIPKADWGKWVIDWTNITNPLYVGSYNPLNGSFTATGGAAQSIFLQWPLKQWNSKPLYSNRLYLVYNITAYVRQNLNFSAIGDQNYGWKFQPNLVESQSTQNTTINDPMVPIREEVVRVMLWSPEFGNATDITVMNLPKDGNSFDIYNNGTIDEDNENYKIVQYFHNVTSNTNLPGGQPHDGTYNSFRIRVVFNCTHTGVGEIKRYASPPVGLLNQTSIFYGKNETWSGNSTIKIITDTGGDLILKPDPTTLVHFTGNGTFEPSADFDAWGVSYISDWLFYNESNAGTHQWKIIADKKGFMGSSQIITVQILPQITQLRYEVNDSVYIPLTQHPPFGNVTYFDIKYMDITNQYTEGVLPVEGATITLISDDFQNRYRDGLGALWSWFDHGDGSYRIYINNTKYLPNNDGLITFTIWKNNYATQTIQYRLYPAQRELSITIAWSLAKNIHSEDIFVLDHNLICLSIELRDVDNASKIVNFENNPYITETWISVLSLEMNNSLSRWGLERNVAYRGPTKFSGATIRYNFTFSTNLNVGFYTIILSLTGLDNFADANITKNIEIVAPTTMINITFYSNTTEFYHGSLPINANEMPLFQVELIDVNYTQILGYTYKLSFTGSILDGNWKNPDFENFETGSTVNKDYRFIISGNIATIYIDIRNIDASETLYSTDINITKNANYKIAFKTLTFRINNATTSFDKSTSGDPYILLKDYYLQSDIDSDDVNIRYYASSLKVIPWGQWIAIKFNYKTNRTEANLNIPISDNTIDDPISASITPLNFPIVWPEFNPTIQDLGDGVHFIYFKLDINKTGELGGQFRIFIFAKNFNPISFVFNITTRDRITTLKVYDEGIYKEDIMYIELETLWSYDMVLQFNYYDDDSEVNIQEANITTSGTSLDWELTELTGGIYKIVIETTSLDIGSNYSIDVTIYKKHYINQSITFNFTINPLEFEIEISIDPSEEFVPKEVEELTILVSVFVTLQDGKKEVNVDYTVSGLSVKYEVYYEKEVVADGKLEWDAGKKKFSAKLSTSIDDEEMAGIYTLKILVETSDTHFASTEGSVKLLALGTREGELPWWFWPLLFSIVGAAIAMAGYGVRKAIYLRIPFVLRKIDETVNKIEKDKFPPVGVMTGRDEFIINSVINFLEECDIAWEREDKFEVKKVGETAAKEKLPPLKLEEIQAELAKLTDVSPEERSLFVEELKRLDREAQDEFLRSLRGETQK